MMPLYAARIEDLGQGDFVKVDCAACHHVALLVPEFLVRLGARPSDPGARPQRAGAVPGMRKERASRGFDQVAGPGRVACNRPVGRPWAGGRCPWGAFRLRSGAGLGETLDAAPPLRLGRWPCQAEYNATRRRSTKCVPAISPPGTRRRWVP
jgi:hypothetical protein